jgi:uncharacterized protein YciI
MLFMVLANDAGDAAAIDRRMSCRADHVSVMNASRDAGDCRFGAAMLDETGQMCGSVIILDMPDLAAVEEWMKKEPYVKGNVWGDIRIIPLKVGPSFEKEFGSRHRQAA